MGCFYLNVKGKKEWAWVDNNLGPGGVKGGFVNSFGLWIKTWAWQV